MKKIERIVQTRCFDCSTDGPDLFLYPLSRSCCQPLSSGWTRDYYQSLTPRLRYRSLSDCRVSAVDQQSRAGDERGVVAREEGDGLRYLLGPAQAADRVQLLESLVGFGG